MLKHTKIGATIGPSCQDRFILEKMVKAGMNFARLNFAHGTHESNGKLLKLVRAVEKKTGEPIAALMDLQGPRIRVGAVPEKGVEIKMGERITLNTKPLVYQGADIPLDHPELHKFLRAGERLLIEDGKLELTIKTVSGTKIEAVVVTPGIIYSHKGINLPDSKLKIPALSDKDRSDLKFGVAAGIDMVGLSFVSNAADIAHVRSLIKRYTKELKINRATPIAVIAKIERHEAVDNLAEIIEAADGIMVARGDLGLELPAEQVPVIQKNIIAACNARAKPVIVATQMLASMVGNPRATRAEISDVANAVIDHADALLLTNETASGQFPVEAVKTMANTIVATEKSSYDDKAPAMLLATSINIAVSELAVHLAAMPKAKLIVAASLSGETGRWVSHTRPTVPVYVATIDQLTCRKLNISWGITPFILPLCKTIHELVADAVRYVKKNKLAKKGDQIIIVAGDPVGQAGKINLLEVQEVR